MGTPIITQADLDQFKEDVINELRLLMAKEKTVKTKWIKNREVKKLLQISNSTLQTLRANGTLSYTKIGGILYYDAEEIEKMMEDNKI
ncbi:MAG: DNA-binding protein, partial [Flavobacteriaceae bacterium CG_4_8_14_3_um_filter_34_10]